MRREEALYRVKDRNIVQRTKRNDNSIGRFLRANCLLKHAIEGTIEGRLEETGRRGRRRKQQLCTVK
jgi:hypothetical protein